MPDTWRACSRPQGHRIHRTQAEADACTYDKAHKHFSGLLAYPALRRKSVPRPRPAAAPPAEQVVHYRATTAVTVDEEDEARQSPASFAPALPTTPPSASSLNSRSSQTPAPTASTPDASPHHEAYPTPITQPTVRDTAPPDELAGGMPLSRLRLRELDAQEVKSATPTSFVAESPRPGSAASAALPGVVQSIEVSHSRVASSHAASAAALASVQVPATVVGDEPRAATPKTQQITYLRDLANNLTASLGNQTALIRDQTALSIRLFTRKEVEAAGRRYAEAKAHAEEMRRHGTEAELQLAHDQLEACQRAKAEAKNGTTAKGVLEVMLRICAVLVIVCWAWCWVMRVDREYIHGRMRAHYGLV